MENMLRIIRRKGLDYRIEEGKDAPSAANKKQVDSNREVFDWYSNKLVQKVVGHASWGPNQKHSDQLSTCSPKG